MARELMTKTRNSIKKTLPGIVDNLKNINVNGRKMGCCGYVSNPKNGKTIYLCTDVLSAPYGSYYYRTAPEMNAPTSLHGNNCWAKTFESFIEKICKEIA